MAFPAPLVAATPTGKGCSGDRLSLLVVKPVSTGQECRAWESYWRGRWRRGFRWERSLEITWPLSGAVPHW